ncbi:transcription antitermination factor NusB [Ancylobacter amanitiformis]|uniref:Transcription antitermination protein NusB n=1 Tax=Ancylobacter amanitiformis TaxID=217069 RepID=A0ABU0LQC7_9HYPH|nr:transcription antitermination factor NusB [Ancylobacter amanitiformis]MDQ0510793.1 N utilization substance protein B [Ancylobacter amanitiformis]
MTATPKPVTAKPATSKPVNHKPLRKSAARLNAVQALYQMDVAATPLPEILAQFESHWIGQEIEGDEIAGADLNLFRDIVGGVVREQRVVDPVLDAALVNGWPLKRIEVVLRAVLRAGAYELAARPDIPARVVVAEYVNVAAAFLDREETGMVNAVLDGIARERRPAEFPG